MRVRGLTRQTRSWVFRRTIPKRLRHQFGGRAAFVVYIGSINGTAPADAARRASELWLKTERALKLAADPELAGDVFVAAADISGPDYDAAAPDDVADVQAVAVRRIRRNAAAARERLAVAGLDVRGRVRMSDLVTRWRERHKPRSAGSVVLMEMCARRFVEQIGDRDVTAYDAADVRRFRDWLEDDARGWKRETARSWLARVHRLFSVAADLGIIAENPARDIHVAVPDPASFAAEKRKTTFTADETATILDAAEQLAPELRHVVRLAAFTGARSGEIANLRCIDVAADALTLTDEGGLSKKTAGSVRTIPLPSTCLDFVAYVVTLPGPFVFPGKRTDTPHGRAQRVQMLINAWLRDVLPDHQSPWLHNLRHRWRTCARSIGMPDDVARYLSGRAQIGTHDEYGVFPMPLLRDWIDRIEPTKD